MSHFLIIKNIIININYYKSIFYVLKQHISFLFNLFKIKIKFYKNTFLEIKFLFNNIIS